MRIERLDDSSTFAFIPALEPLWGVLALLMAGEKALAPCKELYGEETIARWRQKYRFLFECFEVVKNRSPVSMLDFLLDFPLESFSLEAYRDMLLELPPEDFIWRQLEFNHVDGADKAVLAAAMTDDAALDRAFSWLGEDGGSFLAFSAFVHASGRFIGEFFALAAELDTPDLFDVMERQEDKLGAMAQSVREGVAAVGPLAFSQQMMGKTFRNRGPYEQFVFLPAYLIPYQSVRLFHAHGERKRQILFISLHDPDRKREDTVRTLKAVGDPTRYQILTLLAKEGPMRGLDIARKVSIAASTVSHHMEQLKEGGLITEEQVKNAKYYGLDSKSTAAFLEELKKDLVTDN